MAWKEQFFSLGSNLISAMIGGALVIFGERLRRKGEIRTRRAERLQELYTDFLVAFHTALKHNEEYYSGIAFEASGKGSYKESDEANRNRLNAEKRHRECAWRLSLHERDPGQRGRIEKLARAFDADFEEWVEIQDEAFSYPGKAEELRKDAITIIDQMQTVRREIIELD